MALFKRQKTLADVTRQQIFDDKGSYQLMPTPHLVDLLVASVEKMSLAELAGSRVLRLVLDMIRQDLAYFNSSGPRKEFGEEERRKLATAVPQLGSLLSVTVASIREEASGLLFELRDEQSREPMLGLLEELAASEPYMDGPELRMMQNISRFFSWVPEQKAADALLKVCRTLIDKGDVHQKLALLDFVLAGLGAIGKVYPDERITAIVREVAEGMGFGHDTNQLARRILEDLESASSTS